jgi:endonuclease YncB( thermonuclease family)
MQAGLTAKAYTTERLLGQDFVIKTEKTDAFGRWLAEVKIEGVNFNQELIDKGYAEVYRRK